MAKNTKSQRVVFDYDKLAEAIVKAEQKVKAEENKIDSTAGVFRGILLITFGLIAGILLLFFAVGMIGIIYGDILTREISYVISYIALIVLFLTYGIAAAVFTKRISQIKDKSYLLNYFGAMTGLFALIVSLLSYLKG